MTTFLRQDLFAANSGTAPTFTLGAAPPSGSVILMCMGWSNSGLTVSSIAQTGVTWKRAAQSNVTQDVEIWIGSVGVGASTSVTVTVSTDLGGINIRPCFSQFSEPPGTALATTNATGTGATATTGTLTPTPGASVLLMAIARRGPAGATVFTSGPTGTGWVALTTGNGILVYAYNIVTAASGGYSTSWSAGDSFSWDASILMIGSPSGCQMGASGAG